MIIVEPEINGLVKIQMPVEIDAHPFHNGKKRPIVHIVEAKVHKVKTHVVLVTILNSHHKGKLCDVFKHRITEFSFGGIMVKNPVYDYNKCQKADHRTHKEWQMKGLI